MDGTIQRLLLASLFILRIFGRVEILSNGTVSLTPKSGNVVFQAADVNYGGTSVRDMVTSLQATVQLGTEQAMHYLPNLRVQRLDPTNPSCSRSFQDPTTGATYLGVGSIGSANSTLIYAFNSSSTKLVLTQTINIPGSTGSSGIEFFTIANAVYLVDAPTSARAPYIGVWNGAQFVSAPSSATVPGSSSLVAITQWRSYQFNGLLFLAQCISGTNPSLKIYSTPIDRFNWTLTPGGPSDGFDIEYFVLDGNLKAVAFRGLAGPSSAIAYNPATSSWTITPISTIRLKTGKVFSSNGLTFLVGWSPDPLFLSILARWNGTTFVPVFRNAFPFMRVVSDMTLFQMGTLPTDIFLAVSTYRTNATVISGNVPGSFLKWNANINLFEKFSDFHPDALSLSGTSHFTSGSDHYLFVACQQATNSFLYRLGALL